MRCEEFEIRLQRRLDLRDDLLLDQELCSHAAVCHSCDRQLEIHRALSSGAQRFAPEPSFGFSQRVVDEFTSTQRNRNWKWGIGLGICGTIAASILIVLFLRAGDDPIPQIAPTAPPPRVAEESTPQPSGLAAFTPQMGQLAGFVQDMDPSRIVGGKPPISTRPLKPIATGFQTTFDALRRTMPGGRSDIDEEPQAQRWPSHSVQMA